MREARPGACPLRPARCRSLATPLGDPIEVAALTKAFRETTAATGFCALGSVKTNLGHLDTAGGVAGLIKTILALQHREIPPSLPLLFLGTDPHQIHSDAGLAGGHFVAPGIEPGLKFLDRNRRHFLRVGREF